MRPWIAGEKKLFGDRVQLTAVAGTLIFAEIAAGRRVGGRASARPRRHSPTKACALAAAEKAPAVPDYGQGWTDDMFMATAVLARSGARPGTNAISIPPRVCSSTYAARLQQPGGLFHHAADGPAAWGRGNGFAALGLMETLTRLPPSHPSRAKLLEIYRRQMAAVRAQQAPDGMWRQIIDAPGAYREETATAMLMTRDGARRSPRMDRSVTYLPRFSAPGARWPRTSTEDGRVVDVCAGTGAGPTRRYYFDRPAVTGGDDRGGAMALLAALEMHELAK